MKPWMTDAIGTQKTVLPSSVIHADFATELKLLKPGRPFSDARWPYLNSFSDSSKGRHVMMSPALPPLRREARAAL
jgi:hypothetical protein